MGFTYNDGRVRVDHFKSSGKWYSTASVDMSAYYDAPDLRAAILRACEAEFNRGEEGEWGLTVGPRTILDEGGYLVCLEPYHKHSHPIMLTQVPAGVQ